MLPAKIVDQLMMSDVIHALGKIVADAAETTEKSKSYEHTNCRVEPETEERCFNELMY